MAAFFHNNFYILLNTFALIILPAEGLLFKYKYVEEKKCYKTVVEPFNFVDYRFDATFYENEESTGRSWYTSSVSISNVTELLLQNNFLKAKILCLNGFWLVYQNLQFNQDEEGPLGIYTGYHCLNLKTQRITSLRSFGVHPQLEPEKIVLFEKEGWTGNMILVGKHSKTTYNDPIELYRDEPILFKSFIHIGMTPWDFPLKSEKGISGIEKTCFFPNPSKVRKYQPVPDCNPFALDVDYSPDGQPRIQESCMPPPSNKRKYLDLEFDPPKNGTDVPGEFDYFFIFPEDIGVWSPGVSDRLPLEPLLLGGAAEESFVQVVKEGSNNDNLGVNQIEVDLKLESLNLISNIDAAEVGKDKYYTSLNKPANELNTGTSGYWDSVSMKGSGGGDEDYMSDISEGKIHSELPDYYLKPFICLVESTADLGSPDGFKIIGYDLMTVDECDPCGGTDKFLDLTNCFRYGEAFQLRLKTLPPPKSCKMSPDNDPAVLKTLKPISQPLNTFLEDYSSNEMLPLEPDMLKLFQAKLNYDALLATYMASIKDLGGTSSSFEDNNKLMSLLSPVYSKEVNWRRRTVSLMSQILEKKCGQRILPDSGPAAPSQFLQFVHELFYHFLDEKISKISKKVGEKEVGNDKNEEQKGMDEWRLLLGKKPYFWTKVEQALENCLDSTEVLVGMHFSEMDSTLVDSFTPNRSSSNINGPGLELKLDETRRELTSQHLDPVIEILWRSFGITYASCVSKSPLMIIARLAKGFEKLFLHPVADQWKLPSKSYRVWKLVYDNIFSGYKLSHWLHNLKSCSQAVFMEENLTEIPRSFDKFGILPAS